MEVRAADQVEQSLRQAMYPCPSVGNKGATLGCMSAQPLLWSLECTEAQGCDLTRLEPTERSICHFYEQAKPMFTSLRVGRFTHAEFFKTILPIPELRDAVSREHFQIWAQW